MTQQTKEHLISAALTFISGFVVVYGAFVVEAHSLSDLWAPAGVSALTAALLAGIRAVFKLVITYLSANTVQSITLESVQSNPDTTVTDKNAA